MVLHVARVGTDGVGGAVAIHDGRKTTLPAILTATKHIDLGVDAGVGQVNEHANAVHLVDELLALGADTAPDAAVGRDEGAVRGRGGPERGVGEAVGAVVGEGDIADAEVVEAAQVGDAVANLVQALDTERGDELALLESGQGVGRVHFGRELGWVEGLKACHEIDLLKGGLDDFEDVRTSWESTQKRGHENSLGA